MKLRFDPARALLAAMVFAGTLRNMAPARARQAQDIEWCKERGKDYLPVVFPGFSWHNMNP
jgi:hypothetical protein